MNASESPFGGSNVDPRVIAQARLAAIVESSDDAIVSKDLNGVIQSWNKGAERIFGWTSAEVVGKPITIIIPPERLGEEPKILARMRAGERVDHFETVRVTKDGRRIDISVTVSPIRDQNGVVVGASKIARDITLQKRYESQLTAARDAAEAARRSAELAREEAESANRAKDHFLSVLSHELRTPLTPVLGALSLMQHGGMPVPAELAEQLAMIRRNVETEARLVDDLLDVTRIARGKIELRREVVDAHAVVRNVVSMFAPETEAKGLTVAVALRAKRYHVWADPGRFQQVLLNLMSNAVKFTPEDGTITLRTGNDESGGLRIEVQDTGIGIDAAVLPRLFEPFEQGAVGVTRQFGGLGLGLSIVKSLVEMHHASVSVSSEGPGRGTTFTVRMACVDPGAAGVSADGPSGVAVGGTEGARRYRVLLVEDHADTREIMKRVLATIGCEVTAAGSVREAVEASQAREFDLLVSDIGLPDGTGMDVMRRLGERGAHLKGIALSGYGQDEDLRRSREAGFVTHLTKPVNLQTLQEVIRRVAG